mmetsp:Transcript_5614/g.10249  ORF Transcript_5614/g.10249 Transcript_5614/m.10249 type:complete len:127 (-) Transcript_5614:46-426(-)
MRINSGSQRAMDWKKYNSPPPRPPTPRANSFCVGTTPHMRRNARGDCTTRGQDSNLTVEDIELLITWFVAVAHGKGGKSVLKVEMLIAATAVPSFQKWAKIRLGCTMDREENVPLSPNILHNDSSN